MLVGKGQCREEAKSADTLWSGEFSLKANEVALGRGEDGIKEISSRIIARIYFKEGISLAAGFCMGSTAHPVPRLALGHWIHYKLAFSARESVWKVMRGKLDWADQRSVCPCPSISTGHP